MFSQVSTKLKYDQNVDITFGLFHSFLRSIPNLKEEIEHLSKHQIKTILENIKINVYERGSVLINKGQTSDRVFIVLWGTVNRVDAEIQDNEDTNKLSQATLVNKLHNFSRFETGSLQTW